MYRPTNQTTSLIDVHSHILPAVDDGAHTIEEALDMLKIAVSEGIGTMILTPHYHEAKGRLSADELAEAFAHFKKEAEKEQIPIRLELGREICFDDDTIELLKEKKINTMAGTDLVLVECHNLFTKDTIRQIVSELKKEKFRVILAHVERYVNLTSSVDSIRELKAAGAYIQINADSIVGENGRAVKNFVWNLLKEKLVDFVGTDAHRMDYRRPLMKKAYSQVQKKIGGEYADLVCAERARDVLDL